MEVCVSDIDCIKKILNHTEKVTNRVEVISAAVRYAIGNCQGKGSDFMRKLLFPEGKPDAFEEYLKRL